MQTYYGHVKTQMDAILLFEACRQGRLPRLQRRLSERERLQITSGSVYVWDEQEAGMKRWTDSRSWSASRVSGAFLTYREMETHPSAGNESPSASAAEDSYRYKANGLYKQSFSITTSTGLKLHMINYYTKTDIKSGRLMQPTTDGKLKDIVIPIDLYPESSSGLANVPATTSKPLQSQQELAIALANIHRGVGGGRNVAPYYEGAKYEQNYESHSDSGSSNSQVSPPPSQGQTGSQSQFQSQPQPQSHAYHYNDNRDDRDSVREPYSANVGSLNVKNINMNSSPDYESVKIAPLRSDEYAINESATTSSSKSNSSYGTANYSSTPNFTTACYGTDGSNYGATNCRDTNAGGTTPSVAVRPAVADAGEHVSKPWYPLTSLSIAATESQVRITKLIPAPANWRVNHPVIGNINANLHEVTAPGKRNANDSQDCSKDYSQDCSLSHNEDHHQDRSGECRYTKRRRFSEEDKRALGVLDKALIM